MASHTHTRAQDFHNDKEDEQFTDEKHLLLREIKKLGTTSARRDDDATAPVGGTEAAVSAATTPNTSRMV